MLWGCSSITVRPSLFVTMLPSVNLCYSRHLVSMSSVVAGQYYLDLQLVVLSVLTTSSRTRLKCYNSWEAGRASLHHDVLLLLRHSFAIPKVLYILRTSPCFLSDRLDDVLGNMLRNILNVDLALESTWLQATLPVRMGGIGIRRAVQLAPCAYLASAAGCSELIRQVLPSHILDATDPNIEAALSVWSQDYDTPPLSPPSSSRQRAWDVPKIEATYNAIFENTPNQQARARLKAVANSESGAWLITLPISSLGLRMDDDVIRIAVGLRLGAPLCWPHQCASCGAEHAYS